MTAQDLLGRVEALRLLFQDPASNLVATAIGLAIVVLVIVIAILGLLVWALPSRRARPATKKRKRKKKARKRRAGAPPPKGVRRPRPGGPTPAAKPRGDVSIPLEHAAGAEAAVEGRDGPPKPATRPPAKRKPAPKRRRRLAGRPVGVWLGLVLLIGAIAGSYVSTSTSEFCGSTCHSMVASFGTWKASAHKDVSCVRCHEGRPVLSAPQALISRARSAYLTLTRSRGGDAVLTSARCLECHGDIANHTVDGGRAVRMSHAEVIRAGADCTDCHGAQGHASAGASVGMTRCLRCHDGKNASSDCKTCHPKGADASIAYKDRSFGNPVELPEQPSCGGCHSQQKCDACHGLRMPHPPSFGAGEQHAMLAAFDRKDTVCFRCHVLGNCEGECHHSFGAHGLNWKQQHKTYPSNTTWCSGCHKHKDMCALCHKGALK